jgi:hypothetical protein
LAWVHLGKRPIHNYTGIKHQLGLNTELVYFGIKKSMEEKKGVKILKSTSKKMYT